MAEGSSFHNTADPVTLCKDVSEQNTLRKDALQNDDRTFFEQLDTDKMFSGYSAANRRFFRTSDMTGWLPEDVIMDGVLFSRMNNAASKIS